MMESNNRNSETLREEKDKLTRLINEQNSALADMKNLKENMGKKMKIREKRIKDLEEEKGKWGDELQVRNKSQNKSASRNGR